jgi:hypothetical protein
MGIVNRPYERGMHLLPNSHVKMSGDSKNGDIPLSQKAKVMQNRRQGMRGLCHF